MLDCKSSTEFVLYLTRQSSAVLAFMYSGMTNEPTSPVGNHACLWFDCSISHQVTPCTGLKKSVVCPTTSITKSVPTVGMMLQCCCQKESLPATQIRLGIASPYVLPVMISMMEGQLTAAGTKYTLRVAFGSLTLPAGGLSVSGCKTPNALKLSAGESVTWAC